MEKLQRKVLECLLDAYERSKTFQGENQVSQSFSVSVERLFPKYYDDAEYDFFRQVNQAMEELGAAGMVTLKYERQGILKKVLLNPEHLNACYDFLGRTPRRQEQQELVRMWEELFSQESGMNILPLQRYIAQQRIRLGKNQNVEYYDHNMAEYRDMLLAARAVLENQEEVFVRNFSVRLFHDSKRVEQLTPKLKALLYQYGEFQEKDTVLEECGVVHTPTYVMIKGNGMLTLGGCGEIRQRINLSLLQGDIALSTQSLKDLCEIAVAGKRVVTIENLTAFHNYSAGEDFVVYLGGFHNKVKRDFLMCLYRQNPDREYRHFGDIDAGGFYILEHLKRKTGIGFCSLYMDVTTLQKYETDQKPLSDNDRKRLGQLKEILQTQKRQGKCMEDYEKVLDYMLEENCKLEQEAVKV